MKQILQNYKSGELILEDVACPVCKPGGVLVQTAFSFVSSGTERMKVEQAKMSLIGKARARPDQVQKFLQSAKQEGFVKTYKKAMDRLDTPTPLGYSCSGRVVEVGRNIDEFHVGDLVACAGAGFANHAEVNFVPANLCSKIPEGVDLRDAVLTTVGSIALQGVRQGQVSLGENVAVIGLGLVGQIVAQIIKAMSCKVIGIDLDDSKLKLASDLGSDFVFNGKEELLLEKINNATLGGGIDTVIITAATSSNETILLAGNVLRDRGTIVIIGNVKMDLPWKLYYEKELNVVFSRSYGPGRYDKNYEEKGIDYPIGYVRWTEKRNMQTILELIRDGKIYTQKLISKSLPFAQAVEGYEMLEGDRSIMSILFEYSGQDLNGRHAAKVEFQNRPAGSQEDKLGVSFLGAGKFAETMLLPHLKANPEVQLKGVVSGTGVTAGKAAKKFGFEGVVADAEEIFKNQNTNAIFIVTRHDLHAPNVVRGLESGKNVFVEKPLALTYDELAQIVKIFDAAEGGLMVGYNRRFSPHALHAKKSMKKVNGPIEILYRINAGHFPADHWYQDMEEGGGRIIGEVCHFVDFVQFLSDANPVRVYAETISGNKSALNNDNVSIIIRLSDGSTATIIYIANGDPSFEKERVEIFGNKIVAVIENFGQTVVAANGKTKSFKTRGIQKGHHEELTAFVNAIRSDKPLPISFESLVLTTLTTFKIVDSIRTGAPVEIDLQAFLQEARS
ncbi:bi-domain-containing oxidoreductase [candidate division KSB1 bacterium]|nr:bi-domain-containing oxidoreductase [candidate division KSB1 bacterium]